MANTKEYVYDKNVAHADGNSKKFLMVCHLFKNITSLFVSTFLTAHIYTFSADAFGYLFNVAVFYISVYLSMMVFYMILSIFVDKTNRVVFYRISVVVTAILVIIIISFGEELAKLLVLAGCLHGLSEALYYASYNVIKEEMVSKTSMGSFIVLSTILGNIINIVCPILLGTIIDATSYSVTAIIVFVICSVQFGLTFGIKSKRPKDSHYDLLEYKKMLKTSPVKNQINFVYLLASVYGITSLTSTLINVYIMLQFGSNVSLGALSSILAVVSIISLILVKRFTNVHNRKPVFIAFSILILSASVGFVCFTSKLTLIILNTVITITGVLHTYLIEKYRFSILKKAGMYDEIAEHQTVFENRLNISRIVSFGILLLVSLFKADIVIDIFVVVALVAVASIQILLFVFEKKYVTEEDGKVQTTSKLQQTVQTDSVNNQN